MCSSKVYKNGKHKSSFSNLYSDNVVMMQAWRCSNNACSWSETPSVGTRLSGNVHVDLIKLQADLGARHSYRQAAKDFKALTGNHRSIHNKSRIHKTTNKVGQIIEDKKSNSKEVSKQAANKIKSAKKIYAAIDGGHVHDANNKGHNFEVMIAKIYRPENVTKIDNHHNEIIEKHCAASAKYDSQETMKSNVIVAAIKEGADKEITEITVLADGARNCWSIAAALKSVCAVLIYILDWFHIGKYIQNLKGQMPSECEHTLNQAKEQLWIGEIDAALEIIKNLLATLTSETHIKKIENFERYIKDNKDHLINYNQRKKDGLIYTSHVAESSVEHLLNERGKRKQKMQWSRDGLHSVMQIRASQSSNEWENDWRNVILPALQAA